MDKTYLSFYNSYQFEVASRFRMWTCAHFPSESWDLIMPRPVACCHSFCVLLCVEWLFPWCPPSPLVIKIFLPPLLQGSMILEGKELTEISDSGQTLPRSVTFCSLSSCSLCISTHLSREEASPWWLSETMTYGYSRMPFVVFLFCFCYVSNAEQ